MSARQYLTDVATRHQVFLQRFAGGEAKKAKAALNRLRRDINARLSQEPTEFQRNRLVAVLADIDALYINLAIELNKSLLKSASDLVVDEAKFAAQTASKASTVDFIVPTDDKLINTVLQSRMKTNSRVAAKKIDEAISEFAGKKAAQMNQLITDGLAVGDTTQQIQRKASNLVNTLQRRELDTVVHTAINQASSVGRKAVYDANADILDGHIWISTLDNKTCLYCGSRDQNKIMPGGEFPPAHFSCRCTTVPNVKPEYSLRPKSSGRPALSADGVERVESNQSYGAWLKKQPSDFVDEALGAERSRLFRSGKISIDKFTDPTGRTYTLDQLRQMNGIAAIES